MTGLEVLVFVVAIVAAVITVTNLMRVGGAFADIGRQGALWFEHPADREIADLPSEDEIDAPIPRRPLRGRTG